MFFWLNDNILNQNFIEIKKQYVNEHLTLTDKIGSKNMQGDKMCHPNSWPVRMQRFS